MSAAATSTSATRTSAAGVRVPKRLASYQVVSLLGKGGMGHVLRAVHLGLRREVALKVLPPGEATESDACCRFRREAQALARVRHPNVVACFDAGRAEGWRFIAMELLPGGDLRRKLIECGGALGETETLAVAAKVARGLHAAHQAGLVHADVKPANILLDEMGRPRLADFGAAVDIGHRCPSGAGVIGSPAYMAPEQVRDLALDERVDVFGLAATIFHLLTGRPPFGGRTAQQMADGAPLPPLSFGADEATISAKTQAILRRALAEDRAQRFRTCAELATALDQARMALRRPRSRPVSQHLVVLAVGF